MLLRQFPTSVLASCILIKPKFMRSHSKEFHHFVPPVFVPLSNNYSFQNTGASCFCQVCYKMDIRTSSYGLQTIVTVLMLNGRQCIGSATIAQLPEINWEYTVSN